jgi:hypothetical protein
MMARSMLGTTEGEKGRQLFEGAKQSRSQIAVDRYVGGSGEWNHRRTSAKVAMVEQLVAVVGSAATCHKGEQHRGEHPGRSPGRSASGAGLRSDAGITDGVRKGSRSHAFDSPSPGEGREPERPGHRRIPRVRNCWRSGGGMMGLGVGTSPHIATVEKERCPSRTAALFATVRILAHEGGSA